MALIVRGSAVSLEPTSANHASQIPGGLLFAGEALDAGAACYIAGADGLVYMADGTAADEKAVLAGVTAKAYPTVGSPVTLWGPGSLFMYDEAGGLTAGAKMFIAATPGRLDSIATTGDAVGIAQAVDTKVLRITRYI